MAEFDWIGQTLLSKACNQRAIYDNSKLFGFGWWFAYFWKEIGAKTSDTASSERAIREILAEVFASRFPADIATKDFKTKRAESAKVANGFTSLLPEPADLNSNAAKYRNLLLKVFRLGFKELPDKDLSGMAQDNAKQMFKDLFEVGKLGHRKKIAIAYRGETRDFETVLKHGGAVPRAQLGVMNMSASWHPFSDSTIASKSYARGASGDNCLYTVNSIADDLDIPVGFPLIEDQNIYTIPTPNPAIPHVSAWLYKDFRIAKSQTPILLARCKIAGVPGKKRGIFMATENYIYAIKLEHAMHTQEYVESEFSMTKGQCKERGIGVICLDNYVAGARVRRIHLGPARTWGVFGFIQEVKCLMDGRWQTGYPKSDKLAAAHFNNDAAAGLQALDVLKNQFGDVYLKVIVGERQAGLPPDPVPKVLEIEEWNISVDQLNASKKDKEMYFGFTGC